MQKHQLRFWRRRGTLPLRNIVALLAWSASHCSLFLHLTALASSAAGSASAVRPTLVPVAFVRVFTKKENQCTSIGFLFGGEGETRTPAPVTRPTPLAGAPRHQLEYFSIGNYIKIYIINKNGGESGIRTHGTRKGTTVFKTVPL